MRKLILLVLAWGVYEYLRRDAERNGTTPGAALGEKFAAFLAWLRRAEDGTKDQPTRAA